MSSDIKEEGCMETWNLGNCAFQRILGIIIIDVNPLNRSARRHSVNDYALLISLNLTGRGIYEFVFGIPIRLTVYEFA